MEFWYVIPFISIPFTFNNLHNKIVWWFDHRILSSDKLSEKNHVFHIILSLSSYVFCLKINCLVSDSSIWIKQEYWCLLNLLNYLKSNKTVIPFGTQ